MLGVLIIAAGLWWLGHLLRTPYSMRWLMIGLLYLAVLVALFSLPAGSGLARSLGGSAGEWLVLGGLVAIVMFYRRFLVWVRARARKNEAPTPRATFSDTELQRYARHIVLREIGGAGQKRLHGARVLVIGAGGLGSAALQYLAAAGVGSIGVIDDDSVEITNLQRQTIHADARVGMAKVFSAQSAMLALNPHINVRPYKRRLNADNARDIIAGYDVILDGVDNSDTRYLVNRTCVALKKPLIGAALSQWEGQISTYDPASGGPCYQCVFPQAPAPGLVPSCAEAGVLGPLPGVLGTMMAVEAIKLITGAGTGLSGRLMIYDALHGENRTVTVKRDHKCEVCRQTGADTTTVTT